MFHVQKLDLLLSLYIAAIVCAELLGSKIFTVAGITASVGIFVLPLTFTINDIVAEVYGKDRAGSFVQSGFIILVFLFIYTFLATLLPPAARFKSANSAYLAIFNSSLRITAASLTAFWLGERFDVYLYNLMKIRLGKNNLWLRNNVSNFIGQLVDTSVFMFLAFFVPGNLPFIVSLILPYWILKCAFSVIETPFTYIGVRWLKSA